MAKPSDGPFDLQSFVVSHIQNSNEWHIPLVPSFPVPFGLTLHSMVILIATVTLLYVLLVLCKKDRLAPTGITNIVEAVVLFIRDEIVRPNLGDEDAKTMTPLFCTFFFFILTLNLMGLVPFLAGTTGNINVTFALGTTTLFFMTFGAMAKNGIHGFFAAFLNPDLPPLLRYAMFPLEFVGIFIRTAALTIRLFVNLMAGHMILFALIGMVGLMGVFASPVVILGVFIGVLEILVAFLQAYIFTLLSAVFIGHVYHPQH